MKKLCKLFAMLCVMLLALNVLAACDSDNGGHEETDNGAPDTENGEHEGELNLAIFEGGFGRDFWDEVVELFETDNPDITVNLQISPQIQDIILPEIMAGNYPDFLNIQTTDGSGIMRSLVDSRRLADLTDVFDGPAYGSDTPLRDLILPGFLDSAVCSPYGDGRIYMAPGSANPMGMIYNITLFEEMGWDLPVTWDDFFELGELAAAEGFSLFTYQGIHPGYMESIILPGIASNIGFETFESGILALQPGAWVDPNVVAVLEMVERIYTEGFLLPGTVALDHTQAQAAAMQNEALFHPNGTWVEGEMEDAPRADGFRFGLTPPPVMNAGDTRYIMSAVEQLSIPADAPNVENAKLFLRFLYTDEVIALYAEHAGAVMATVNGLEIAQPFITDGLYGMFGAYNQEGAGSLVVDFMSAPEDSIININEEIFGPVQEVLNGEMTAEVWAEQIDAAMRAIEAGE